MEYEIKNGKRVCKKGWVVIEGIRHFINNGYVICNPSLNSKAWNTTNETSICKDCLRKIKVVQTTIF